MKASSQTPTLAARVALLSANSFVGQLKPRGVKSCRKKTGHLSTHALNECVNLTLA